MKLNKTIVLMVMLSVFTVNIYAKEINLRAIKVDYINFDKISVDNFFGFLSKEYNVNFSIAREYRSRIISIHLQNSTLKGLLNIVTIQNDMTYNIKDNIIFITSNRQNLEKKYTTGKYVKSKVTLQYASVSDTIQFLKDMMPGQTIVRSSTENKLYSNLYNANPDLAIPLFRENQTSGQNAGAQVYPDTMSNMGNMGNMSNMGNQYGGYGAAGMAQPIPADMLYIIPFYNENKVYFLSTKKHMINEAKRLVRDIDKPSKQVLIQGKIIEVTVGDGYRSIFDFSLRSSKIVPDSANPLSSIGLGNLHYSFLDSALVTNIDIAKKENRASFISSPMLLAMNRVSATLDLTEDVSIITGVSEGKIVPVEGSRQSIVVQPAPIYETKKLGTELTITPYINSRNEILLKIDLKVSSLSGNSQTIQVPKPEGGIAEFTFDGVSESEIKTVLTTANKKTIIFGGLIRNELSEKETKVPILGDIPIIGIPFRKTEEKSLKKELIVILTPTIVDARHPRTKQNIRNARKKVEEYKDIDSYTGASKGVAKIKRGHSLYDKEIEEFLKK